MAGPASSASCGSISRTSAANAPRSCSSWLPSREPKRRPWETLTAALGLKGLSVAQRWTAPAGIPALSGVAALGAFNVGGQSMVAINFYHYGDPAAGTVARETPLWQA